MNQTTINTNKNNNFQEDFQFLLKNLSEKGDTTINDEEKEDNINRTRKALVNVINYFIADFEKLSQNLQKIQLTPIFHMIDLYIQQYSELFLNKTNITDPNTTIAREFTNFLLTRLLRILTKPELDTLHSNSCKLIITLFELSAIESQIDFDYFIHEFIHLLKDLIEIDRDFYDRELNDVKYLDHFKINSSVSINDAQNQFHVLLKSNEKQIEIETPSNCESLQYYITYILNEICVIYINLLNGDDDDSLYNILWNSLCQQLELGDYRIKIGSLKLMLSIIDIRIMPLNKFDMNQTILSYIVDCLISCFLLLFSINDIMAVAKLVIAENGVSQEDEFDGLLLIMVNKIFNNDGLMIDSIDFESILVQLVDFFKENDVYLTKRSDDLRNSFFYLINFVICQLRKKSAKNLFHFCMLSDIANVLISYIGRFKSKHTYLNMCISQIFVYEIEILMNEKQQKSSDELSRDSDIDDLAKLDNLKLEHIQTNIYKQLINKAKQLLFNTKQNAKDSQELHLNSVGLNSILEILNYSNYLCQSDNFLMFENDCRNLFIETASLHLFNQASPSSLSGSQIPTQVYTSSLNDESIYNQLIHFWQSIFDDVMTTDSFYIAYLHSLNTIKTMYLTTVEWKKNLLSHVVAILSLPWLANESNGLDFDLYKDRSYKQYSSQLIQRSNNLTEVKCYALTLLCTLSKSNACVQWRTHLIKKCLKDEQSETIRKCTIKYLPFLLYNLGVSANSLIFQLIQPSMLNETNENVLCDYATFLHSICCLISRKCFLLRKNSPTLFNTRDNYLISIERELELNNCLFENDDFMANYQIICTCCDRIDVIKSKIIKQKNKELIDVLINRPKFVDANISTQFIQYLTIDISSNNKEIKTEKLNLIKSRLLINIGRCFNHLEFPRRLLQSTNDNLALMLKQTMLLFSDPNLNSLVRAYFSRFTISKLVHTSNTTTNTNEPTSSNENICSNGSLPTKQTQNEIRFEHNFNLESQLCEGFLKAKSSENILDQFFYIVSLGRFALQLNYDEYLFVCVKHLLEIFDSNDEFSSGLAQLQLLMLSKQMNMQQLLNEFSDKLCEIISDAIYNTIYRHQILESSNNDNHDDENSNSNLTYLQEVNYCLKDLLKVFNISDSCMFIRSYSKYLVPNLIVKANSDMSNYKVLKRSLDFLARKTYQTQEKLIEDNFPYIFTYTSLNTKDLKSVFDYIKHLGLDNDKLINFNKQRLFNELLSRCGSSKHKSKVWHAIRIISSMSPEEFMQPIEEGKIAKLIEPNLLAALIHFDMCLMRSSVNIKEKCQVLESLNVLIGMLGSNCITKVRYKIMTTLKLAMQQCFKYSELNCKLWDTFVRNVDKNALGPILNQISVNLLKLLDSQPYKISKIFTYLIIQNSENLKQYFNELYFIPEHNSLTQINQILYKYIDVNYLLENYKVPVGGNNLGNSQSDSQLKSLVYIIKHYLKGALHENADLRVKALEKLYQLLKNKAAQIILLIQRQENYVSISEILYALLNGCRDTDSRAKLLFGCCLGEIGAIDPAIVQNTTNSIENSDIGNDSNASSTKKMASSNSSSNSSSSSPASIIMTNSPQQAANDYFMQPSLVGEDSSEFSEYFSYSLIMELSKAYLAARNTHEQDSASFGIQECLKIYGCSATDANAINKMENKKLWNSFPDYIKEILTPLRTSKYEIQSFDNFSLLKTPIILSETECKTYEEWVYKWCAYLISKLSSKSQNQQLTDKEIKIFPKLAFIIRFNVNVALFILPYIIIKIIMLNNDTDTINQIYDEIMSVVQLNKQKDDVKNKKILRYQHICCQTVFNIYDHLTRQLNYYRTKLYEIQASINNKNRMMAKGGVGIGSRGTANSNDALLSKYRDTYELFNKFILRISQQIMSKASLDCKAYCRALMHYEVHMRNSGSYGLICSSVIKISQNHLNELQNIYASMDEIDTAAGVLLLRKGSDETLGDAAFRHKINGRLNESIACLEQMIESDKNAKDDIKQHEIYIKTYISVGRHRNALSYLEGLMNDKGEWKDALNEYRIEACWKLGSWDKLQQIIDSKNTNMSLIDSSTFDRTSATSSSSNGIEMTNLFNAGIGKLFYSVYAQNSEEFNSTLRMLREQQISPLSAVSMESGGSSYQRGYEYLVNLQIIQEMEITLNELLKLKTDNEKEQYRNLLTKNLEQFIIEPWERRVECMQPSYKHLEPIYSTRIALLNFLSKQLNLNVCQQQAKLWLRLAKISRKAGMFENAYQHMLNAQGQINSTDTSNLEELLVEKSKWYWQREDKDSALFYLQKGLNELFNNSDNMDSDNLNTNSELYSKVLIMYTKFSEENGSLDSETIRKNYLKVQKMCSKMEQSHFQLAQFTDRLAQSVSDNTGKKEKFWEYLTDILSYYATSLEYGCQYIYQSLPRMMSVWLDFGADYFDHSFRESSNVSSSNTSMNGSSRSITVNRNLSQLNVILTKLNQIISNALQRIPTYTFLSVYSQLVSRICHPEERVFETLSNIIMKVLFVYPSQAIWMLIAVKNSSVELRKMRCKIIVDKAIKQQPDLKKFINDSSELAEKLVQLGNLNVEAGVTQISLSTSFKPLKRLVESKDFSRILIPSQFQITLQLPMTGGSSNNNSNASNANNTSNANSNANNTSQYRTHNPYPLDLVYIYCFEDAVSVMNSLQKPKKVSIRGTDGKIYSFLCKAKDDLRIDYRIMEFFSVVNKCLKQEPEARRRNLYIRTYAVTPLNEYCGIIEWIENLATMRSILVKLYSEKGVGSVTSSEWKMHEDKISKDKEYALKVYKTFVDRYKPTVLYEWFLRTFPEPNSWYIARLNYVRTAAVMSICGYVLGLGDRHCENILMASSNGDCIHVDFNCLFNKGETLGVPEIVPFRLTHNMTEAMGPLCYEGVYRKVCEVSLKILRDYRESLITILKTFIYDPLVEWKTPANAKSNESGETISAKVNENGQIHLQNIISRLKGMHAKQWISANQKIKALPLSVEGHVTTLIKEATDERNLSLMYIGWAPFF